MSIDLPTADEPAVNLDIEEAGLWLRFFVACVWRGKIRAIKKPAGMADGLQLFGWRAF
ncbi:hypothetical protein [Mesorhizobium sp. M7A.F.Ca.MR.245.00.0.0]|uniref:hypothetical protein n=1 Tax=Mesorhizobium sp. M7A.F.Ca.MR.245.00.0.0 TaxID=2496778 RepID=UPI0013E30152|nr:hypothetical protein [Mesorhizobium sp. M7A.F.Ca.MR.245.00.0.0]